MADGHDALPIIVTFAAQPSGPALSRRKEARVRWLPRRRDEEQGTVDWKGGAPRHSFVRATVVSITACCCRRGRSPGDASLEG
jgi:hypothetical protein